MFRPPPAKRRGVAPWTAPDAGGGRISDPHGRADGETGSEFTSGFVKGLNDRAAENRRTDETDTPNESVDAGFTGAVDNDIAAIAGKTHPTSYTRTNDCPCGRDETGIQVTPTPTDATVTPTPTDATVTPTPAETVVTPTPTETIVTPTPSPTATPVGAISLGGSGVGVDHPPFISDYGVGGNSVAIACGAAPSAVLPGSTVEIVVSGAGAEGPYSGTVAGDRTFSIPVAIFFYGEFSWSVGRIVAPDGTVYDQVTGGSTVQIGDAEPECSPG